MQSNKSKLRIVQDFVDFNENKPDGIYLSINQEDIFHNYALIVGPRHTPYFGGYYLFEINFPKNYPNSSPSLNLVTIDGKVRLNPNLYENGKVCLSILGTWNGPGWKKVMNIRSVLLSVQSLLHEYPIRNEPGHEDLTSDNEISVNYNHYVTYHNYNLAIIKVIESLYSSKPKIKFIDKFKEEIISEFKKNFNELNQSLLSYQITLGVLEFERRFIYFIRNLPTLDFLELTNKFEKITNILEKKNEFNLV